MSTCISISPLTAWGFGGSEGGDGGSAGWSGGSNGELGGGCCSVPEILREDAKDLRDQFVSSLKQDALDSQILGTLCQEYACGGLTEPQASLILERLIQGELQLVLDQDAWWNWLNGFIAAMTSVGGLLVAAAGLFLSGISLRTARKAEFRSKTNEDELSELKALSVGNEDET